jgi:nitrogen fixation NifU-like protein
LKIDKKTNKIKDIRFETLGCLAAIASSDMICELVKGKTLTEAKKIKFEDILKELGDLPPLKVHCSVLATRALKKAIEDYRARSNEQ